MTNKLKIAGMMAAVSGGIGMICLAVYIFLISGFAHAPRLPQPLLGDTVPFNYHGGLVYISEMQDRVYKAFRDVGVAAIVIAIACNLWGKRKQ